MIFVRFLDWLIRWVFGIPTPPKPCPCIDFNYFESWCAYCHSRYGDVLIAPYCLPECEYCDGTGSVV